MSRTLVISKRQQDAGCELGALPVSNLLSCVLIRQLLCVAVLVASGLATNADAADVRLREQVTPSSSVVRLGDVAEIKAADRQEAQSLASIPLMPAPAPGTQRFMRRREVADMLAAHGVEIAAIHFSGSEYVAVAARSARNVVQAAKSEQADFGASAPLNRHAAILAGHNISPSAGPLDVEQASKLRSLLCQIIGDYVKLHTNKADVSRIECKLSSRQLERLNAATSVPICSGGAEPWLGRQDFTLTFATAAGNEQLVVRTDVPQLAAPVVVVVRPVARGNVITAADLEVRMLDLSTKAINKRVTFDTIDALIGKEARQALAAESIVYLDQIQAPILVKRGEIITVASQGGGIRVRTTAKATQDGSQGDLIQVESLDSKQRFDARVVGIREATVYSPTPADSLKPPKRTVIARQPTVPSR